jgi:hypothetical protein
VFLPLSAIAALPDKGLGVNLNAVRYWSPALPFADVFMQAGAWIPQRAGSSAWNTGEPLDLDDAGWVRSLAPGQQAAVMILQGGWHPAGLYRVIYDGRGEITLGLDARVVRRQDNELLAEVKPNNGIVLKLLQTDPADPVRNIRFFLPNLGPASNPSSFNPAYLDYLQGFKVIRFMDWANTNLNDTSDWRERTRTGHATQDRKSGVALEHMLQFAQELQANPWFNVPHAADDTFVRQMAESIRSAIPAGRKFYIEYSNEVWNRQFPQHAHATREAARLGLRDADAFYMRRALQIFAIFEEVFGGSERFVRVLAGQAENVHRAGRLLSYPGIAGKVDAYAIAPYFGHRGQLAAIEKDEAKKKSIDALVARLAETVEEAGETIRANVFLARRAGVELIAYEAGQHVTNPPGQDDFCAEVNRHPAMTGLYGRYMDIWERETGGALLVLFTDMSRYGRSGCWGLSEYHGQTLVAAPKLQAVRARLARNGRSRR